MTWRPRSREGEGHASLPLDARQGFLLSRLDGTLDIPTLASLMGLEEPELEGMLRNLVALGAVEPGPDAGPRASIQDPPEEHAEGEEDAPTAAARAATHRQLFEQRLHPQPVDERVAQARVAVEPELSAFCFDPTAEVVRAVLENPRVGSAPRAPHRRPPPHQRGPGGPRRADGLHERRRRAPLPAPESPPPGGLYRRLWSTRRLLEQYLVATSRDAPEQVRAMARDLLRASFTQRTGEEKAELIFTTEGRCLASLVGLTLDGHATALLCRRTYVSTLLIQNIARWSAAPPQLIAHLRRQDAVKRNAPLRQLLERHPNAS